MWESIFDTTLKFFANIGDFVNWLFSPLQFNIPPIDNEIGNALFGWFVNWLNSIELAVSPIDIFGIGGFVVLLSVGILKLIF